MAIYNKGTTRRRPLAGTAASSAQQLATQVATQQSRPPNPNGLNSGKPLDTTGRQEARGPASGPLRAPTVQPAQTGPRSFTDPRSQNHDGLKGITQPKFEEPYVSKTLTAEFAGTPPPVEIKDGKLVNKPPPVPLTEQEMVDAAVRKLLEDQSVNTEKERAAMQGEMKVAEARDIQSMRARTGLGGMGLTGAAGAMESQVRTEGARKQALTTAEFDRQARQEEMARTIAGIEAKFGKDAANRASEAFGIEKELATEELGVMRSMFPEGPAGDAEFEKAKKQAKVKEIQDRKTGAADKDAAAAETIKNASQAEFEAMKESDLVKAGWTLDDTRQTSEDGKRYYYNWTSPDGKTTRRAYIDKDDWGGQEHHSGGVEW